MLTVYLDESGTADSPMLVLAGYMADASKWTRFQREWRKILLEFQIPYFHMNECAHFRGPFEGWTESRRKDLLGRLAFTITTTAGWSLSCSIPMKDYNEVVPEWMRKRLVNPYFFCVWACFPIVFRCYRGGKISGERIDFVFDHKAGAAGEARKILQFQRGAPLLTEDEKKALGSVRFDDDCKVLPLQAADYLAYEVRKYRQGWTRQSLLAINDVRGAHEHLARDRLVQIVSEVEHEFWEFFEAKVRSAFGEPGPSC